MSLQLAFGHATDKGPRPANEDFGGFVTPEPAVAAVKGYIAALADGVSGGSHGREAAESTVRNLLSDYYATPETWEIAHSLSHILQSLNRWLNGQAVSRRAPGGMACTLSTLVLRGRRWHFAHVGDTRIYRLRGESLECLTQDHTWEQPGMEHVLKRAVGLDTHLTLDHAEGDLAAGDVFALVCDGVWEPLGLVEMHRLLQLYDAPEAAARGLVAEALRQGGGDNASALVVRVEALGQEDDAGNWLEQRHLPLPGRLRPGAHLEGFVIDEVLHDSRETLLYRAHDAQSGRACVLKTLQPRLEGDTELADRLLMEEWTAKRVQSHYFAQILPLPAREHLYFAMEWHAGQTLQALLENGRHFGALEAVSLGIRLLKGLSALHRLDVAHRDIKPANLLLAPDGKLRILDLGVASCPGCPKGKADEIPGTPSYMAPELISGSAQADQQTDLYAVGVTLYHLLTRKYPYGEIEAFQRPRFGDPVPPTRVRPDIPGWLENALLKACAREPGERFETAEEFLLALERGEASRLARPRATPLAARDPLRFWQGVAVISIVFNLLLLFLLLAGR
ncbi:MAG: bifunctional protein-serine/threonine kinase/phosphatase [Betaproteobacteria bacterium]|nr:bifunctional protein-serine/threonine kinase/phosphatase [Betaproteobacteria bacterium]